MSASCRTRNAGSVSLRRSSWGLLFLLCLVSAGCTYYYTRTPAKRISYEEKIGREFALEASGILRLMDEPEVLDFVKALGRRITGEIEGSRTRYRFFVVRDPVINAFAVPGGYIYTFAGLLARVENIDELAGVMAHEAAHVEHNHFIRGQKKMDITNIAVMAATILAATLGNGEQAAAIGTLAQATSITSQLQYSREFEREADQASIRLTHKAGYAPEGILTLFETFQDQARVNASDLPPYFSTHPLPSERIYDVQSWVRTIRLPPPARRPLKGFDLARLTARIRTEDDDKILAELEQAIRREPDSAHARFLLGFFFLKRGDTARAGQILEKAYHMDDSVNEHALYLARALQLSGETTEAGGLFERVIRKEAQSGKVRLSINEKEAQILLENVIYEEPENGLAHVFYGDLKAQQDEWDSALAHYQEALVLNPDSYFARMSLGMAYGRHGEVGMSYYQLGLADKCAGRYLKALHYFKKAMKHLPKESKEAVAVEEEIRWLEP